MITTVLFRDHDDAKTCNEAIGELRSDLNLSHHKEFHFSKDNDGIRRAFLKTVCKFKFEFRTLAIQKTRITNPELKGKEIYRYAVRKAFNEFSEVLQDAVIVFDRCGGREFNQELNRYLRSLIRRKQIPGNHNSIKQMRSVNSRSDNLIQLADMICGSVARSLDPSRKWAAEYREIVGSREASVVIWPPDG